MSFIALAPGQRQIGFGVLIINVSMYWFLKVRIVSGSILWFIIVHFFIPFRKLMNSYNWFLPIKIDWVAIAMQIYLWENNSFQLIKLSCDSRFQHAFTACICVFKVIMLVLANQSNYFESANACTKRVLKMTVATHLKLQNQHIRCAE